MLLTSGSPAVSNPANVSHPPKVSAVHRTFLVLVLALTAIPAWKLFATLPQATVIMDQVVPAEARAGEAVMVTGFALDAAHIEELYLINEDDAAYRVEILTETGTALRFRVPLKIPTGTLRIAIRAPGRAGLIDQMVYLKVVDPVG